MRELKKEEEILLKYNDIPLKKACILYGVFAIMIAGAGIWLAYIGEELAQILSLGQNFVGSLFLGFATTLPEITVSVAALRIGAKELAVANMLGSNLFNMSIIFLNDVLYRKAPIFNVLSQQHIFTALIVILMTIIVCVGLIMKPNKKAVLRLSNYAVALIITFIIGAYINFILGKR
jgi:cation:H+ antiporter